MIRYRPALCLAALTLSACQPPPAEVATHAPPAAAADAPPAVLRDRVLGLTLPVPPGWQVLDPRQPLPAAWQAFGGEVGDGTPVMALALDGSNTITTAQLRIARSDHADALAHCLEMPPTARPGSSHEVTIGGVPFQAMTIGDAAMSHYLDVDAYRAVRDGQCVAIDLLVSGTRPEVYDPPATPPFGRDHAGQALQAAMAGLRWTGRGSHP